MTGCRSLALIQSQKVLGQSSSSNATRILLVAFNLSELPQLSTLRRPYDLIMFFPG